MTVTGADALVAALRRAGIRFLYGNTGTTEVPLLDVMAGDDAEPRFILALHESQAVAMADGYARATGQPGAVLVHAMAGLTNCLSSLYNAFVDGSPVVILVGEVDARLQGTGAFLEHENATTMTRQITKASWRVERGDRIPEWVARAIRTALAPPAGPVVLTIPEDLLYGPAEAGAALEPVGAAPPLQGIAPHPGDVERAAVLLSEPGPIAVIAGNEVGAWRAEPALVRLAEACEAVVVTEMGHIRARLNFPQDHRAYVGEVGPDAEWDVVADARTVLGVGCRFFQRRFQDPPYLVAGQRVIHVHTNPAVLGVPRAPDVAMVADPATAAAALLEALGRRPPEAGERERRRQRQAMLRQRWMQRCTAPSAAGGNGLGVTQVIRTLSDVASAANAVIVDDAVASRPFLLRHYDFRVPGTYHSQGGGILGWGGGAAVGMRMGGARPVVAVLGDGCLLYGPQCLWSAARYGVPVVFLVINNRGYVSIKQSLRKLAGRARRSGDYVGCDLAEPTIDMVGLATSLGVEGHRVTSAKDLAPALEKALASMVPVLLDVVVGEEEYFAPDGTSRVRQGR
jgi:benzoylformate decarboxylase